MSFVCSFQSMFPSILNVLLILWDRKTLSQCTLSLETAIPSNVVLHLEITWFLKLNDYIFYTYKLASEYVN